MTRSIAHLTSSNPGNMVRAGDVAGTPSEKPTVDVAIVSYNTRELLEACLQSLFDHSPDSVELQVSVFDNASGDGTAAEVRRRFPTVRLVESSQNIFYGPANNALVSTSTADFVLFLNPDTALDQDILTPLVQTLEAHPDVTLAYTRILDPNGHDQVASHTFPNLVFEVALALRGTAFARRLARWWSVEHVVAQARQEPAPNEPVEMTFVLSTCAMMRRVDALAFGPFDARFPMYDVDLDLCRRLWLAGGKSMFLGDIAVQHVGGASSTPARKRAMERTGRRTYYRIHAGWFTLAGYRLVSDGTDAIKALLARSRTRR